MDKYERLFFHLESEIYEYEKVQNILHNKDFKKFVSYVRLAKLQYKKFKKTSGVLGVWKGDIK